MRYEDYVCIHTAMSMGTDERSRHRCWVILPIFLFLKLIITCAAELLWFGCCKIFYSGWPVGTVSYW